MHATGQLDGRVTFAATGGLWGYAALAIVCQETGLLSGISTPILFRCETWTLLRHRRP